MKKLKQLNNWSYKEAWEFFTANAVGKYIPETEAYIRTLQPVPTIDLRTKKENAGKLLLESIKPRTFILIDGPSNNGKSTLANRIAKKTDADIVDIDMICGAYMRQQIPFLDPRMSKIEAFNMIDRLTDKYLLENLESIICEKSKTGRPVILVGMYLEIIYRCIIVKTLGKYFDNVISVLACENTFSDVQKLIESRRKEFGGELLPFEKEKNEAQYKHANSFISQACGLLLGFGMSKSFIVNTSVSDQLL